ncbi:hypothetical protein Tco_0670906 [Tanacetum coccineum]
MGVPANHLRCESKCRNKMGRGLAQRPVIVGVSHDLRGDSWGCVPQSLFWREDLDEDGERGFDCLTVALVSSKAHREGCRASRGGFSYWGLFELVQQERRFLPGESSRSQLQDTSIVEAKLSSRGNTSVASMYQTLSYVPKLSARVSARQCTNFDGDNAAHCLMKGLTTPCLLRGLATPCLLRGLPTPCLLRRRYSLVIASGPEVAFVAPAISVDRSNME